MDSYSLVETLTGIRTLVSRNLMHTMLGNIPVFSNIVIISKISYNIIMIIGLSIHIS